MLLLRPQHINEQHWESIQLHAARVANQIAEDAGGLIGACKELVECVAKVVLLEATSPELEEFPKLIKKACTGHGWRRAGVDIGQGPCDPRRVI